MQKAVNFLTYWAIGLTLMGTAIVTWLDSEASFLNLHEHLNAMDAPYQFAANGLFLLIGIFWIATLNAMRRALEPKKLDTWFHFSVLAFAASYILTVIFPCDQQCPIDGSLNQTLHNSLVWVLYSGPAIFAVRVLSDSRGWPSLVSMLLIVIFVLMQVDSITWQMVPGLWQWIYELLFCLLWYTFVKRSFKENN